MSRAEFHQLMQWAAAEGWNPGLSDEELFWQTDPEAFIAIEDGGRMVGGGAIVSYAGRYGFMGLFIVDPARRGAGLGRALWIERRDRLRARLNVGAAIEMDGVFAMQHFYAAGGFVLQHRDLRFEGIASVHPGGHARDLRGEGVRVRPLSDVPFAAVASFDSQCFPAAREDFLRRWFAQPGATALAACRGDEVLGFAVRRPCVRGHKIGPLFAVNDAVAAALLDELAGEVPGQVLQLDAPERNVAALRLAAARGMVEVFGCARMTLGQPPAVAWDRVFGVTTFELG